MFAGARSILTSFRSSLSDDEQPSPEDQSNPYIHYPVVTTEQLRKIDNDKFRFEFGYNSFAHHSLRLGPMIHSLSDLTVPTDLTSLLPKRRPQGSLKDTLSIRAGDDAMLVSPTVLVVADGVSGWESKGEQCSSGIWARSMVETLSRLMTEYKLSHAPHQLNNRDIEEILNDSYLHTSHLMDLQGLRGSLTLVLGMLSGEYLKMISIGDSKLYIIRNGEIVKRSEEQLVSELCPQQIGTQTLGQLPLDMAWVDSALIQEDDIIVLCSDGISDNLYESEILEVVRDNAGGNIRLIASKLVAKAKGVAFDDYAYTPYNEKVNALPERFGKNASKGGKLDDISVCVARVALNGEEKKSVSSDDL